MKFTILCLARAGIAHLSAFSLFALRKVNLLNAFFYQKIKTNIGTEDEWSFKERKTQNVSLKREDIWGLLRILDKHFIYELHE
jgi:hypothetical protein